MPADPSPATAGPTPPEVPRSMLGLGAALGAGTWWCDQVFTVTGGWVPSTPEAAVRVHLAELSRVVGDHGVALRRHLPRPGGTDPQVWVHAPSSSSDEVVARLAALGGSPSRLAGLHRVLVPRLLVAWRAQAWDPSPADRGVARTLGHAHRDLRDLWLVGEGLLEACVDADAASAEAAHQASAAVEIGLIASGGLIGPVASSPPT